MRRRYGLILFGLLASGHALAQPEADTRDAEARQLYQAGAVAFDAGRYENALEAFEAAHALSGRPELLFNIGQTADRLRRDAAALAAFEAFVDALPEHAETPGVRRRIALLRDQLEEARSEGGSNAAPWALAIGGAVVTAGGAAVAAVGVADRRAVERPAGRDWSGLRRRFERSQPMRIAGGVAAAIGAGLLAVGLVLRRDARTEVGVGVGAVRVRWRF